MIQFTVRKCHLYCYFIYYKKSHILVWLQVFKYSLFRWICMWIWITLFLFPISRTNIIPVIADIKGEYYIIIGEYYNRRLFPSNSYLLHFLKPLKPCGHILRTLLKISNIRDPVTAAWRVERSNCQRSSNIESDVIKQCIHGGNLLLIYNKSPSWKTSTHTNTKWGTCAIN